ncbi:glycosyltransferase family A protein [Roseiarcaceae bacterium H3SJ34-1]|uniref:glycosyltransferase family 2 protein n=1 Tax=Terripilifer ovatus TaxID=3032367 RepID=UPI003AB96725|nr:glycosyltransferase family A protein [Roseiarcaceae bacterium H3SJ34-1]
MTISVVIAVHNRRHLIGETLRSLLDQSRPPDQVIVVDDASSDGTPEVVERFGADVTLIRLPTNRGPGGARNAGLAQATGEYVQFFDSDDIASRDFLASKLEVLLANNADICYGPWLPVWLENGMCRHDGFVRQARPVNGDPLEKFLESWVLFVQSCLISRRLLNEVGGYPENMRTGEDMLLVFRMLEKHPKLVHTSKPLLLMRQHPETQISTESAGAVRRAVDELVLTDTVLREISPETARVQSKALAHWRGRHAQAVKALNSDVIVTATPSRLDHFLSRKHALVTRCRLAISARLAGHRIHQFYQPQMLDSAYADAIRQLGYQPLLNS